MIGLGLSGTARFGRSRTESSDYREPFPAASPRKCVRLGALNRANQESFGFLLTRLACAQPGSATPRPPAALQPVTDPDSPGLTAVDLVWDEGACERWLRFGRPAAQRIVDRRRRIEYYAPEQIFALVRWVSNAYGTVHSSLAIVRAVAAGEPCQRLADVTPGGEVLLAVSGWGKVAQVLRLIDGIEQLGIDPCDAAPDHWRHIHNRLAAAQSPRRYSHARHRAWLLRKMLQP